MALPHFACCPCSSYCFENALPQQGECSRSTCLLTFGLALWLRNQSSVALPRTAPSGGRNGGVAGGRHRVAGIPDGRLAVEEVADLLSGQGLVFQEGTVNLALKRQSCRGRNRRASSYQPKRAAPVASRHVAKAPSRAMRYSLAERRWRRSWKWLWIGV